MDIESAATLARKLISEHGLPDWTFEFDRARTRFGLCVHHRSVISLSLHLTRLNEERHVRDTILHEIAHAKAGYRAAHGPKWRAAAVALGCPPRACYDRGAVAVPARPWKATCPNCASSVERHRRLDKLLACARCCRLYAQNRFDRRFLFVWARAGR